MLNRNGIPYVCLAVVVIIWCKPMKVIALEECKDIFSESNCKAQANTGGCNYPYTLKNCRKTCDNCTITTTTPPTQATTTKITTTKVTTTIPHNNNLSTTPLINISTTAITKHYTNFTHSGSLCKCAPTSFVTAALLWILGSQVIELVV